MRQRSVAAAETEHMTRLRCGLDVGVSGVANAAIRNGGRVIAGQPFSTACTTRGPKPQHTCSAHTHTRLQPIVTMPVN